MYTDSHCHLNFPELQANLGDIRQAMHEAQVSRALLISTRMETFADVNTMAVAHDNFWCTVGVHPDNEGVAEPTVAGLLERAVVCASLKVGGNVQVLRLEVRRSSIEDV